MAPSTYAPVRRSGKQPKDRVHGNRAKIGSTTRVTYDDGVRLQVKLAQRRSEQGAGPGSFPGRGLTVAKVSFTNGSKATVDLTQVVVTTTYGKPARIAAPVYQTATTTDLTGVVAPGATATGEYAFAIANKKAPITITVDWAGSHAPAVFTGQAS